MEATPSFGMRLIRLVLGLILLAVLLFALFGITLAVIPTYGATEREVAAVEPGDDILTNPAVRFTNAITINAPPDLVWGWVAQIGDTRGGFYSYTFIENQIGALMGASDYRVVYHNAERIVAEWQNPQIGDEIIQGSLKISDLRPGEWLLADAIDPSVLGWTWIWHLYPLEGGQQTRLISRFLIEPPPGSANPVMDFMMNVGGFVMHQNMMQGIKLRAEGGTEPEWSESVEIVLWTIPLITGVLAAAAFVWRRRWQAPLLVSCASVVILFVITFVQPALIWRVVLDVLLMGLAYWALFGSRTSPARQDERIARAAHA